MIPQFDCATAVADMLNGQVIDGETINTSSGFRLLPKYETADLCDLKVDVVPGSNNALVRISRCALQETCPIVIGVQRRCNNDTEYTALISIMRQIAAAVANTPIQFVPQASNVPSDDVEFTDDPAMVDSDGVFRGVITTTYTAVLK